MTTEHHAPRRIVALIPAAILVIAALNLQIPYFTLSPGPVEDVGSLTRIEGAETYETQGVFMLTTVRLRSVTVAEALRGIVDPTIDVVPREAVIPPDRTEEEQDRIVTEQMQQSQLFAAAAALDFLGYDVQVSGEGVIVMRVDSEAPASEILRAGDVITAADGEPVAETQDLIAVVDRRAVGETIELTFRRRGEERTASVQTIERAEDPERPMIGIMVDTVIGDIELPISVEVDAKGIGGPSAGLMFALNLVDALNAEDLARGRIVAGTGVITLAGQVTPVGGVAQKVAAARRQDADIFFAPEETLPAACAVAGDLMVLGVSSLEEAVSSLRDEAAAAQRSCS